MQEWKKELCREQPETPSGAWKRYLHSETQYHPYERKDGERRS